uniref:Uncharacterized protein n=1 Tax=Panagrolaimus sp. JU765 TaxID=591449 RepID=A0AC34RGF4_9BILA
MRSLSVLAVLLAIIAIGETCHIIMKFKSETRNKFRVQVVVPALNQQSERILFTEPGEKKITIKGENCNKEHWVVRTWKQDGEGNWVNAKEVKAKFDGRGWIRTIIGDDYSPFFMDRSGILCSEGFCG